MSVEILKCHMALEILWPEGDVVCLSSVQLSCLPAKVSIFMSLGAVELENLPLKKDALRELGLPVEVRSGFIGKVKLQVPVSQFRSAPWVILIENLYLTVGPILIEKVCTAI